MSLRELKTIMEYIDSKIRKLKEELVEDLKRMMQIKIFYC